MGAPGLTTPLRTETFKKLQLNAGICLVDFDYTNISTAGDLKTAIAAAKAAGTMLGATRGGGTFNVTREVRIPEADGMRYRYKGCEFVDSADAYLTTTLLEITPENLQRALGSADIETSGTKTTITMHTAVEESDYLENVCWIGDTAEEGFVLICIKNAYNTADFVLTYTDKGEGTLAVEFHAHQDEVDDYDEAPFEIVHFATDGTIGSLTITSAAGTNVGGTKITTTNTLASGEGYVYKVGNTAPTIGYYDEPDYTWTEWDGSSDLAVGAANNSKKITVAVVNSSGRAIKSGNTTLTVKTA